MSPSQQAAAGARDFVREKVLPALARRPELSIDRREAGHRVKYHGQLPATVEELVSAAKAELERTKRISLYAHMPFCAYRCKYCHYPVRVGSDPERIRRAAGNLKEESSILMNHMRDVSARKVSSLYIGGGTPMLMSLEDIDGLLTHFRNRYELTGETEISIEGTPETYFREKIDYLLARGIRRMSVGVQIFDDEILRLNSRNHTSEQAVEAVKALVAAGVAKANVDLIYGFPGQAAEKFYDDVLRAIELGVPSVTIYRLRLGRPDELGTAISKFYDKHPDHFPPLEELYAMQYAARQLLEQSGYMEGPSGWFTKLGAKAQVYRDRWVDQVPLFGIGWHTYSYSRWYEYYNHPDITSHTQAVSHRKLPIAGGSIYDQTERQWRWLFFQLKSRFEASGTEYSERFGDDTLPSEMAQFLERLMVAGLSYWEGARHRLTSAGQVLVEEIIM